MSAAAGVPGYWLHETGPELRPAVWAYLRGGPLSEAELAPIRGYLRQWMAGPWQGPDVDELRRRIDEISSRIELELWLSDALDAGIDPL